MTVRAGVLLAITTSVSACSVIYGWDDLSDGESGADRDRDRDRDRDGGLSPDAMDGSAALSPCDRPHDLCDDFTTTTFPDLSRWTLLEKSGAATGTRSTETFVSGPAAFRAETAGENSATLVKGLSGPITSLACEFSVKSRPYDGDKVVFRSFAVEVVPKASSSLESYALYFSAIPDDAHALGEFWTPRGGGGGGRSGGPSAIPADQWMRVRFELTIGSPSSTRISYNGAPVGSMELTRFPLDYDTLLVKVGAMTEYPAVGGIAHFDDVVCDVTR